MYVHVSTVYCRTVISFLNLLNGKTITDTIYMENVSFKQYLELDKLSNFFFIDINLLDISDKQSVSLVPLWFTGR